MLIKLFMYINFKVKEIVDYYLIIILNKLFIINLFIIVLTFILYHKTLYTFLFSLRKKSIFFPI